MPVHPSDDPSEPVEPDSTGQSVAGLAAPELRHQVERRVAEELGHTVRCWSRVVGGAQNQLFRLDALDGPPLLVKLYATDRWPRLATEYATLKALNQQKLRRVPRALLRDDEYSYAVYSFEAGAVRTAAQLTRQDVEQIALFVADLHRFGPQHLAAAVPAAVDASLSPACQREVIHRRLTGIETFAGAASLRGLRPLVDELLRDLVDETQEALPRESWRLTSGDFGPHNMLFRAGSDLTVVDFEAAGWDDPAHMVMGFVAHATSESLPGELSETFLGDIARITRLSPAEQARYEVMGQLLDVEWVAVYASALSGENMANKRSALQEFSIDAYVADVLEKIQRRLARAVRRQGYRFPR